ncbi:SpoIIE family protein phosphatase [Anaerolineales bacterium HSG24]|nr:SpoIIE family protein phosphatase [Anaerolineales bacterium HSG24]
MLKSKVIDCIPTPRINVTLTQIFINMNQFSIILIERTVSEAAKIVRAIGGRLANYRLSVIREIVDAIDEPEPTQVLILTLSQLQNEVSELTQLGNTYPNTPIILLTAPEDDETFLLEALAIDDTDYITSSPAGRLSLGRRIAKLEQDWQRDEEKPPTHSSKYIPPLTETFADETISLYQMTSVLATIHEAQTIINIGLSEYLQATGLNQGRVIRFNRQQTKYETVFMDLFVENFHPENSTHHVELHADPLFTLLSNLQSPVIVDTVAQSIISSTNNKATPFSKNLISWFGDDAQSILVIPLKIRGSLTGVIVAESPQEKHHFDRSVISIGQAIAHQLSLALQNVNLYENEQKQRRLSEILQEVAFSVGTSLKLNEVLDNLLIQLNRIIHYDIAFVFLIENGSRHLIAGSGYSELHKVLGQTNAIKFNPDDPLSNVVHTRRTQIVDNLPEAYPKFKHPVGHDLKSWMGIPLIAHDQIIGLVSTYKTEEGSYDDDMDEVCLAFGHQVAIAFENARLHEIAVNKLGRELEIAQEIQETLLPQVVPQVPGLQISGRILPARQVGGDFFHFFPVSGGDQLGVAVGDVSGKGIPAALYMAVAITAIDIQVRSDPPPGELMNQLNGALYERLQENKMNIGLQVATFEPLLAPDGNADNEARGVLMTTASGGMIAPIGATERGCRFLPVSGLPIGALPPPDQTYEEDMFLLDPFTTIIFTSDGIVEAQNETGELFGFDRLEASINEIAHIRDAEVVADYVINAAQLFMGQAEQSDDMTVVVVVKT